MGRPLKDVKYKLDARTGLFFVSFLETPGHYFQTPETDRDKAIAWARRNKARLLSDQEKPIYIRDLAPGFFDQTGAWYQDRLKKGRGMTDASLGIRQGHVINYIIPLFGDFDVRSITGYDIDQGILQAQSIQGEHGSLAKGTRAKILYSLKLMFDRWIYEGIVRENPTAGIVKYTKEPEHPRSMLPDDTCLKLFPGTHGELIRVWGSAFYATLMLVLFDTGARPGEVRAVRWRDYYPEDRLIVFRRAVEAGKADKIKGTKTSSVNFGYLSERTKQELEIYRQQSRFREDDDFIFTLNGKVPITSAAIGDEFKKALSYCGFESTGWTPYWLRHTFVTYSLRALEDYELQMLVGHESRQTNNIYRHPTDEILKARTKHIKEKLDKMRGD